MISKGDTNNKKTNGTQTKTVFRKHRVNRGVSVFQLNV